MKSSLFSSPFILARASSCALNPPAAVEASFAVDISTCTLLLAKSLSVTGGGRWMLRTIAICVAPICSHRHVSSQLSRSRHTHQWCTAARVQARSSVGRPRAYERGSERVGSRTGSKVTGDTPLEKPHFRASRSFSCTSSAKIEHTTIARLSIRLM